MWRVGGNLSAEFVARSECDRLHVARRGFSWFGILDNSRSPSLCVLPPRTSRRVMTSEGFGFFTAAAPGVLGGYGSPERGGSATIFRLAADFASARHPRRGTKQPAQRSRGDLRPTVAAERPGSVARAVLCPGVGDARSRGGGPPEARATRPGSYPGTKPRGYGDGAACTLAMLST
jgi:hypothetical protein